MKVSLFSDTVDDINGVARFVRSAAQEARRTGRDLEVLACGQGAGRPNVRSFTPRYRGRYRKYPDLEFVMPPVAQMVRRIRARDPDVIHVATPGPVGLVGMLAAKVHDKPLAGVYHTDIPAYLEELYGRRLMRRAAEGYMSAFYGLFQAVFARSTAYRQTLLGLGLSQDAVQDLPPGLDTGLFHPGHRRDGFWGSYTVRPDSAKLLYVGRVAAEKNVDFLAELWGHLSGRTTPDGRALELVIVGEGPRLPQLRAIMAPGAHFLGYRHGPELAGLYANADLFVFPSTKDTLGQVVMESQACGLPAIVTDQGGPKTIVEDGRTGRVLAAGDARAWADVALGLLGDADLPRMGAQAASRMQQRSFSRSFDAWWEGHERLVRRGTGLRDRAWTAMPPC